MDLQQWYHLSSAACKANCENSSLTGCCESRTSGHCLFYPHGYIKFDPKYRDASSTLCTKTDHGDEISRHFQGGASLPPPPPGAGKCWPGHARSHARIDWRCPGYRKGFNSTQCAAVGCCTDARLYPTRSAGWCYPAHKRPPPPPPPSHASKVDKVHVVWMNHLDVGFTNNIASVLNLCAHHYSCPYFSHFVCECVGRGTQIFTYIFLSPLPPLRPSTSQGSEW